jgi:hypothetical protein
MKLKLPRNPFAPGTLLLLLATNFLPNLSYAEGYWREKANELLGTLEEKSTGSVDTRSLSKDEVGKAFRQALSMGAEQVVAKLGKVDGFNTDPLIRILVPEELKKAKKLLKKAGMDKYANDLELRLNRAAELATPKAKELFLKAIKDMSFDDVMDIYKGPEDSATRYFQKKMSPQLVVAMRPVIETSLSEVKAARSYKKLIRRYNRLPFTKKIEADLTGHVMEKSMAGIFHYMAKEEAAIRKDPVKQTTDLLKRVFGRK